MTAYEKIEDAMNRIEKAVRVLVNLGAVSRGWSKRVGILLRGFLDIVKSCHLLRGAYFD